MTTYLSTDWEIWRCQESKQIWKKIVDIYGCWRWSALGLSTALSKLSRFVLEFQPEALDDPRTLAASGPPKPTSAVPSSVPVGQSEPGIDSSKTSTSSFGLPAGFFNTQWTICAIQASEATLFFSVSLSTFHFIISFSIYFIGKRLQLWSHHVEYEHHCRMSRSPPFPFSSGRKKSAIFYGGYFIWWEYL